MTDAHHGGSTFNRALSLSFLRARSLFVLGAFGLFAYGLSSLPLLVAGGVAYSLLVGRDLSDARTWRRARREVGDPRALSELPEVNDLRDPVLMRAARQLDDGAARLINRGDELFRYLRSQDPDRLRSQIKDLARQIEGAQDGAAREQYTAAKAAREQQLETLSQLQEALGRVHANVARIVAVAEGLPGRVVHLRTLDGQAADALSGDVGQELDRLSREVAEFEETLKAEAARVPAQ
jgi:hypothetical protein